MGVKTLDDVLSYAQDKEKSMLARKFEEELWVGLSETAKLIETEVKYHILLYF